MRILNLSSPRSQTNATVTFHKYYKCTISENVNRFLASELINNPSKEADTLYKQYHTTLSTLIDKHAPPHAKHTKAKYVPGWVNKTVIAAKETKCLLEQIWHMNSPSKSCSFDPWPPFLILDYQDNLIIPITSIINVSLEQVYQFLQTEPCCPDPQKIIPRQRSFQTV